MIQIFCLKKEDIRCNPIGDHFMITTKEGIEINFDNEAWNELLIDLTEHKVNCLKEETRK